MILLLPVGSVLVPVFLPDGTPDRPPSFVDKALLVVLAGLLIGLLAAVI